MLKFIDMAIADKRFSGDAANQPSKMSIVGLIQVQQMMGMIAPRSAYEIQRYFQDHIDEINDFSPRMRYFIEQHEDNERLDLNNQARYAHHVVLIRPLYFNGVSNEIF